jgi:hypothetical protein
MMPKNIPVAGHTKKQERHTRVKKKIHGGRQKEKAKAREITYLAIERLHS